MKKLTKVAALTMACATAATTLAAAGCGEKDKIIVSPTVVNVRVYKGGYGTNWIYELADRFAETYKEQQYTINILKPSSDIAGTVVQNELSVGGNGIDLYLAGNVSKVGEYVEDLSEIVYNKAPIGFDGKEEKVLYKDKLMKGMLDYSYDSDTGKQYTGFYMAAASSLVVNTAKLEKYGLEIPNTTDELFAAFDKIVTGEGTTMGNSQKSNIYPHTFMGGVNGYATTFLYTIAAQMLGYEDYEKVLSLVDENGENMIEDGYKMYADERFIEINEVMFRMFDQMYATDGVLTQDFMTAQSKVMMPDRGAVFYICGDWFLNEMKKDYGKYLDDVTFARVPVISALGEDLFGSGTTLNLSAAKADELLSFMIEECDALKTADEIVASVKTKFNYTITKENAERVMEARGIYYNRGVETNAVITKNSPSKEVAALFLRYIASDDAAQVFLDECNATSPFSTAEKLTSEKDFVNKAAELVATPNSIAIFRQSKKKTKDGEKNLSSSLLELQSNLHPDEAVFIAQYIVKQNVSMYNTKLEKVGNESVYSNAGNALYVKQKDYVATNWQKWLQNNGFAN